MKTIELNIMGKCECGKYHSIPVMALVDDSILKTAECGCGGKITWETAVHRHVLFENKSGGRTRRILKIALVSLGVMFLLAICTQSFIRWRLDRPFSVEEVTAAKKEEARLSVSEILMVWERNGFGDDATARLFRTGSPYVMERLRTGAQPTASMESSIRSVYDTWLLYNRSLFLTKRKHRGGRASADLWYAYPNPLYEQIPD